MKPVEQVGLSVLQNMPVNMRLNELALETGMEPLNFDRHGECTLCVEGFEIRLRVCEDRLKMMAYLSEEDEVPQHLMVQMLHENHIAKNRYTFIRVALGFPAVVTCIELDDLDGIALKKFIEEFREIVLCWKPKFAPASLRQCEKKMKREGVTNTAETSLPKLALH
ncbi:type III secretion system chaperone [Pseudovibrio sp. Tun.PSC04-5.I4]|uniref:type III secretion system chaperone n=1 Tax=Pseudovibrio sp. Tun.PSC04-5.I4 TaxID=1798213 RepID=UPI000B87FF6D|nr:type III secretion system chaperone [Pseudovibrio sp. Tun.PSC04-5.I4]